MNIILNITASKIYYFTVQPKSLQIQLDQHKISLKGNDMYMYRCVFFFHEMKLFNILKKPKCFVTNVTNNTIHCNSSFLPHKITIICTSDERFQNQK